MFTFNKQNPEYLFTDEQLHVVEVEPAELEKCEEISEVSANTICTQTTNHHQKCEVRKELFFLCTFTR